MFNKEFTVDICHGIFSVKSDMNILQAKVTGSKSEDNFESALEKETGNTDANAANGTQPSSLPEEKVPL